MKKRLQLLAPALLVAALLLSLGGCSSTGSTNVHVGVGVYHPYGYGPGWGGGWRPGYYPPRPIGPIRPPHRPVVPTPY